ncbi:MAG: cbb3-type cytochrome c oxidase subunit I [Limisphaerales bacterium]
MTSVLSNLAAPGESGGPARGTALLGFTLAAAWALLAFAALLLASVKLHSPSLLADTPWLTYGRLHAAGTTTLLFGFILPVAALAGLGLLARLGGGRGGVAGLPLAGTLLWNLGVAAGTAAVLAGRNSGAEWLEYPARVFPLFIVAAALWAASALVIHARRDEAEPYPAAWFLLAALLVLPWFLTVIPTLGAGPEAAGMTGVVVRRWALNGLVSVAAGGVGLAGLLYLVPKLAGVPLASRQLALLGFWAWIFFAPWAVTAHGDPVPRWLVSAGVAGRTLAAIGFLALACNLGMTLAGGGWAKLRAAAGGRWLLAGLAGWMGAGALAFLVNLRAGAALFRLTWFTPGLELLVLLAFLLPVLLALQGDAWSGIAGRPAPAVLHGLGAGLVLGGVALVVVPLLLAGVMQGFLVNNPERPFLNVMRAGMGPVRLVAVGWLLV